MRVCVLGAKAALARPVIEHYRELGHVVTEVGREASYPKIPQDVLVTMCGKAVTGKIESLVIKDWTAALDDNLVPVVNALRCCPVADGGNVVVVGSIQSKNGYGCAAYAMAKAGLEGLVRAAALEWASRNVCVNLLELGYIDAGMGARLPDKAKARALGGIPLGRFGSRQDVLEAVLYLASVRYMTGNVLTLAGGMR